LVDLRDSGENPDLALPDVVPSEAEVKTLAFIQLTKEKGSGYASRLIGFCDFGELPPTIVGFLEGIYALFPKPAPIPPIEETQEAGAPVGTNPGA
jgi:hypothetical protein